MAREKFYWMKLPKDFFKQPKIKKLKSVAGGDTYISIYLAMGLSSIENGGRIKYEGLEDSFAKEMALLLDESEINVQFLLSYMEKYKMIEKITEHEYLLPEVALCIGSETAGAERVRRCRARKKELENKKKLALQCNVSETNSNTEIDKDIDIDKEIEVEKDSRRIISTTTTDLQKKEVIDIYMNNINYSINSIEYERLIDDIDEYGVEWVKEAITRAVMQGKRKLGYIEAILNNWKVNGYDEYKTKNKVNTANSSKLSDAEQLALNRAPKSLLDEFLEQEGIKKNG